MIEVKSICVMYFPKDFSFVDDRTIEPFKLMKELNRWAEYESMDNSYGGYIWWCFFKENITEPELQVFHPKDFTEIQYQELRDMVMEEIKKLNTEK